MTTISVQRGNTRPTHRAFQFVFQPLCKALSMEQVIARCNLKYQQRERKESHISESSNKKAKKYRV